MFGNAQWIYAESSRRAPKRFSDSDFHGLPKAGYRGIEKFVIPEGCDLETEGNLSLDQFKESAAVELMLKRFYGRENVYDGARLEPKDGSRCSAVTLRGMLFVSCSPKVNVYGGVADIAKEVCNTVDKWTDVTHDSNATLFVCFVGVPKVRFGNKWLKMPSGASLETIYNRTAQEYAKVNRRRSARKRTIQQRVQALRADWL